MRKINFLDLKFFFFLAVVCLLYQLFLIFFQKKMRSGRNSRADAITNSPFVRALIKPMLVTIPPKTIITILPPTLNDLIPTQPINTLPSTGTLLSVESEVKLGKRKRDEGTEEEEGIEKNENFNVEVNYSEENLPLELTKCT